ncbi:hypothetical protein [Paraburkholderia caffeinilytica]|uniref:hypothetical protein n=1 Tax=Paraburkholderia caffeinilytica TaxID=1761016 RepID=UPI000E214B52|nr:hypothetical protein [Paraburkholderia caffeinilytica]CAB3783551.1 hypothetical protein LMG28690_01613 [Paraburkholderia caffeinilytica]
MLNDTDFSKSAEGNPNTGFDAGAEPSSATPPARFGRLALCVATASALAFGVVGTVAYGVWFNHDQQAYADAMARARQALGTAASAAAGPTSANSIAPPRPSAFAPATRSATATATAEGKASGMQAPAVESAATGTQVTAGIPAPVATPAPAVAPATAHTPATAAAPVPAIAPSMAPTPPATAAAPGPAVAPATAPAQIAAAESDGEEGGKLASWSGPVTRLPASTVRQTSVADATPAVAASSAPAVQGAAPPANPAPQQLASGRPGRDARLAQQDRRAASNANARHKGSLFARMSSFFRRVSYRQHGTGSQQDVYSHP